MASRSSLKRSILQLPRHEPDNVSLLSEIKQLAVKTAKYHGTVVAVKKISCSKMIIDRDILIEMTYVSRFMFKLDRSWIKSSAINLSKHHHMLPLSVCARI